MWNPKEGGLKSDGCPRCCCSRGTNIESLHYKRISWMLAWQRDSLPFLDRAVKDWLQTMFQERIDESICAIMVSIGDATASQINWHKIFDVDPRLPKPAKPTDPAELVRLCHLVFLLFLLLQLFLFCIDNYEWTKALLFVWYFHLFFLMCVHHFFAKRKSKDD